jgi:hypothetical protein
VFDACHAGVVLRAVLFVETVIAVGALFGADSPPDWLARMALLTGVALPATLAWLVAACSLKQWLERLSTHGQYTAGVLLGALAGLGACAITQLVATAERAPWIASAASGALLAALLVAALVLRARGRTPAATTARLTELQSRIRPHFLFNSLNSAIALVRDEPAKAESLLEDLSDLFRSALVEQGEAVTLAEEIRLARRYLAIEQVRFGERLRLAAAAAAAAAGGKRRQARGGAQHPGRQAARADRAARQPGGGAHHQHPARRARQQGRCVPWPRHCTGQCARPPVSAARRTGRLQRWGAGRPVPGTPEPARTARGAASCPDPPSFSQETP